MLLGKGNSQETKDLKLEISLNENLMVSSKYQGQEKLLALTRPLPQRVLMDNFGIK